MADAEILQIVFVDRNALSLFEFRRAAGGAHGDRSEQGLNRRSIAEHIGAKFCALGNGNIERGSRHAERILAGGIGVESSGALGQIQRSYAPAFTGKAELRELQCGIFREIKRRAILEFHFRKAVLRGQRVTLLQGQVDQRLLPGIAARVQHQDLPLHAAHANHADGIVLLGPQFGCKGKNQRDSEEEA